MLKGNCKTYLGFITFDLFFQVDKSWPSEGRLRFQDVQLRYGEDDKLVLNGVNFDTEAKEKVGAKYVENEKKA